VRVLPADSGDLAAGTWDFTRVFPRTWDLALLPGVLNSALRVLNLVIRVLNLVPGARYSLGTIIMKNPIGISHVKNPTHADQNTGGLGPSKVRRII
jgi:hypothetical protein